MVVVVGLHKSVWQLLGLYTWSLVICSMRLADETLQKVPRRHHPDIIFGLSCFLIDRLDRL